MRVTHAMYEPTFQPAAWLKAPTWHEDGDPLRLAARNERLVSRAAAAGRDLPTVERRAHRLAARRHGRPRRLP